jgi:hypothetical protein
MFAYLVVLGVLIITATVVTPRRPLRVVRRYRTGRLDLVLGGDFDLLEGGAAPDES